MKVHPGIWVLSAVVSFILLVGLRAAPGQDAPDVGPHPPQPLPAMESHIGHVSGHAKDGKMNYRR